MMIRMAQNSRTMTKFRMPLDRGDGINNLGCLHYIDEFDFYAFWACLFRIML